MNVRAVLSLTVSPEFHNWYSESGYAHGQRVLQHYYWMYFIDHPPPHFHAYYGEAEAVYTIQTLEVLEGGVPRRAHNLVLEWASAHRAELMANWNHARLSQLLSPILPLE